MNKRTFLPDLFITVPTLLLLSFGILVISSSDTKLAFQQALFALLGLGIYWILSYLDFEFYESLAKYLYFITLGLLIVVFFIGFESHGAIRWIPLGILRFQPSELAKPVVILFLAHFWSKNLPNWKNIFLSFLYMIPILGLIIKQPDLGTALTIFSSWFLILIGANISMFKLGLLGFLSVIMAPLGWHFLHDYQKERLISFFAPQSDPLGVGYNVIQAMIAVGSGEFFGRGLGRGTQSRLKFLPEFRTDFIFASIAEEFGFLGGIIVLTIYTILLVRCFKILVTSKSQFGKLLILGVLGMLFFQITVNIGMNLGLVPVAGITLPFISYGGSSLLSLFISLSFVSSVGSQEVKLTKNFDLIDS